MTSPTVHLAWSHQNTLSSIVKAVMEVDQNSRIIQYGVRPVFNFRDSQPDIREIILSDQTGIKPLTFKGKYIPSVQIASEDVSTFSNGNLNGNPNDSLINTATAADGKIHAVIMEALTTSGLYIKLRTNQLKLSDLNARERTVVMLAAEGVPNKTIARRLNVSVKTIEHCRRKAYSKLDVTCSAEVASLVTFDRFFSALDAHAPPAMNMDVAANTIM